MKPYVTVTAHSKDWCHLCGERTEPLVDITWFNNAECKRRDPTHYLRACVPCLDHLATQAKHETTLPGEGPYDGN